MQWVYRSPMLKTLNAAYQISLHGFEPTEIPELYQIQMSQRFCAHTIDVRSLTEHHELYNRIVHLQNGDSLAMHDG